MPAARRAINRRSGARPAGAAGADAGADRVEAHVRLSVRAALLVGLEQPSAGRILIGGLDVTASPQAQARRIATVQMIFQDPQSALNPRRRVASIVTQAMEVASIHASWDERLQRTRQLLAE